MTAKQIVIRLIADKQISQEEALTLLNELDKPYYPYYQPDILAPFYYSDLPLTGTSTSGTGTITFVSTTNKDEKYEFSKPEKSK